MNTNSPVVRLDFVGQFQEDDLDLVDWEIKLKGGVIFGRTWDRQKTCYTTWVRADKPADMVLDVLSSTFYGQILDKVDYLSEPGKR